MWSPRPTIPKFRGPYTVGTTEYEIPISSISSSSLPAPPDPAITTLKFRLFYPTATTYHNQTIPWVPAPQRQWTEAFGRFLGASLGWSSIVNPLLSLLSYITIPAIPNAPLHPLRRRKSQRQAYPLVIFSHGLAGNCNTYSSFCGSMASCGMIVAAIEHRDGSCPVTMLRGADGKVASQVDYRKYPHTHTPEVYRARNAQMRTRMWELDLLFTALGKINAGEAIENYAAVDEKSTGPIFSASMDLRPGRITWAGHSFGACTITQFIKSIYYNDSLPSLVGTEHENDPDWEPLYHPRPNSDLIAQITPSSPVTLLDVWTMPFRAPSIQWLWERPMPCWDTTQSEASTKKAPTTISIMSTEFYNWTEMLNRTRILMSANPIAATEEIARQSEPRSPKTPKLEDTAAPRTPKLATPPNKHPEDSDNEETDPAASLDADLLPPASLPLDATPAEPVDRSASASPSSLSTSGDSASPADSPASSTTSLSPSLTAKAAPIIQPSHNQSISTSPSPAALYHIPHSAHLSQSDFGPLFPSLTRILMKAVDPVGTMQLNVRAAGQCVRNAGVEGVERVDWDITAEEALLRQRGQRGGGQEKRGWFSFSWLGRSGAESEGGKEGEEAEDEEAREAELEELRQDSILQDTGIARWKELDVPHVTPFEFASSR